MEVQVTQFDARKRSFTCEWARTPQSVSAAQRRGLKASFSIPMVRCGQVRRVELAQTIDGHAPFLPSDRLTRVCLAHALAALTKPPAHRDRRLRPPRRSPARCQVRGVRARRSRKPA